MSTTDSWRVGRARIASLSRSRTADDPEFVAARRDFYAARLAEHVESVVAKAPPFTDSQRDRIVGLLSGGASA